MDSISTKFSLFLQITRIYIIRIMYNTHDFQLFKVIESVFAGLALRQIMFSATENRNKMKQYNHYDSILD